MDQETLSLLRLLLARLERISADSHVAHRASGIRGSLLRTVEMLENGWTISRSDLRRVIKAGFSILERAAREKAK